MSAAAPTSTCLPNVTHDPYENSLTLRPVPPRRRYSKGTPPHAPRKLGALASSKLREGIEPASATGGHFETNLPPDLVPRKPEPAAKVSRTVGDNYGSVF